MPEHWVSFLVFTMKQPWILTHPIQDSRWMLYHEATELVWSYNTWHNRYVVAFIPSVSSKTRHSLSHYQHVTVCGLFIWCITCFSKIHPSIFRTTWIPFGITAMYILIQGLLQGTFQVYWGNVLQIMNYCNVLLHSWHHNVFCYISHNSKLISWHCWHCWEKRRKTFCAGVQHFRVERGVCNQRKPTYFDVDQTGFSPRQNPLELRKKNGRRVTAVERVLFHVASDIAGVKGLN